MSVRLPKAEVTTLYKIGASKFDNPVDAATETILAISLAGGRELRSPLSKGLAQIILDCRQELREVFDWYDNETAPTVAKAGPPGADEWVPSGGTSGGSIHRPPPPEKN